MLTHSATIIKKEKAGQVKSWWNSTPAQKARKKTSQKTKEEGPQPRGSFCIKISLFFLESDYNQINN
jgi:hypothetical protein